MINITLTKKLIRFVRNFTRANAVQFLDLQNSLQALLPKGSGTANDSEETLTVSVDIAYILPLFEGIGALPEKYYAEINQSLKKAIMPQLIALFTPVVTKHQTNKYYEGVNKQLQDKYTSDMQSYTLSIEDAEIADLPKPTMPTLHVITPLTSEEEKVITLYKQLDEREKEIDAFVNAKCEW
jgi:hypothetical protein